jgi:hypothetical protein
MQNHTMLITRTDADATPRACVFCGSSDLSREHVLPRWLWRHAHGSDDVAPPLVDKHTPPEMVEVPQWITDGSPSRLPVGKKATVVSRAITVKVVCRDCNHGWIYRLEADAKSTLLRIFANGSWRLSPDEIVTLQRWAAKTTMMFEYSTNHPRLATPAMLGALYQGTALPGTWHFGLTRCSRDIGFELTSSQVVARTSLLDSDADYRSVASEEALPFASQATIGAWKVMLLVRFTPYEVVPPASLWHDMKNYPVGSPLLLNEQAARRRHRTSDLPRFRRENLEDLKSWGMSTHRRGFDSITCVQDASGKPRVVRAALLDMYCGDEESAPDQAYE